MTVEKGIEKWNPIVKILSAFSDTLNLGLSDGIKNDQKIDLAINQFKQLVTAIKAANSDTFETFAEEICD